MDTSFPRAGFWLTFIAVGGLLMVLTHRSMNVSRIHAWPDFPNHDEPYQHFASCTIDGFLVAILLVLGNTVLSLTSRHE